MNRWIWIVVGVLLGATAVAVVGDQMAGKTRSRITRMLHGRTDSRPGWLTRVRIPWPPGLFGTMRAKERQREEAEMVRRSTEDLERELGDTQERLTALEAQAKNSATEQLRLRGQLRETVEELEASRSEATAQLASLRQQLAEIRAQVGADQAVSDRVPALSAAQDWLLIEVADQAELVPEDDVSYFRDPDAPEPGAQDTDPAGPAAGDLAEDDEVSLVRVSLYRLPNSGGRPRSGAAGAASSILIERTRMSLTSAEYRRIVGELRGPGSQEPSVDALFDAAAEAVTEPGVARFDRWTEFWRTPVSRDVHQLARRISLGAACYHELVLGTPVELAVTRLSVAQIAANGLTAVAAELTLPGDSSSRTATRLIRFTGAVVGLATGRPLLANACLKSLAHDWLSHQVSHAIAEVLRPHPNSRSGREPRGEADRMDFWSLPDRAHAAKAAEDIRAAERRALWSEMRRSEVVREAADSFSVDTHAMRDARDHAQQCLDRGASASRLAAARQHVEGATAATLRPLAAAQKRHEAECAAEWEQLTYLGMRIDSTLQQTTDPDTRRALGELMDGKQRLSDRAGQHIGSPVDLAELSRQRERMEGRLDALRRDMDGAPCSGTA